MKTPRTERIAEEIRKEVSHLLHFELKDPRLEGMTVTGVKMTPDLRTARVYFTIPGHPDKAEEGEAGLKSSSGVIKRWIAEQLSLKFVPQFEFFYDESIELQEKIDALFEEIKEKRK